MKIAVIGTGALGSLLAATLYPANSVILVGRWPEQRAAIEAHGLTLIDPNGERHEKDMPITADPHSLGETCDIALVAVKSIGTAQAARDAAAVLRPTGLGVSFQNGLGNLETLQAELGVARATAAVTAQGATMVAPGTVRHAGLGFTVIGQPPSLAPHSVELANRLCAEFTVAGWDCRLSPDLGELVWAKLAVNAAINPLTGILGVPNGALLDDPAWTAIMIAAAREVATVANALAIRLDPEEAVANALNVAHNTATNISSMLQDIRRGVPSEIDAICGAVVAAGTELGVAVPVNATLLDLVRQIDHGAPQEAFDATLRQLADSLRTGDY